MKKNFYFTFGTDDTQPFYGGWVLVLAKDRNAAVNKFRRKYPDKEPGTVNCAFIYSQEDWDKTTMGMTGNFGRYDHDRIE